MYDRAGSIDTWHACVQSHVCVQSRMRCIVCVPSTHFMPTQPSMRGTGCVAHPSTDTCSLHGPSHTRTDICPPLQSRQLARLMVIHTHTCTCSHVQHTGGDSPVPAKSCGHLGLLMDKAARVMHKDLERRAGTSTSSPRPGVCQTHAQDPGRPGYSRSRWSCCSVGRRDPATTRRWAACEDHVTAVAAARVRARGPKPLT